MAVALLDSFSVTVGDIKRECQFALSVTTKGNIVIVFHNAFCAIAKGNQRDMKCYI